MWDYKLIKKAVLPVAGLGTRFLPASKAIPKEMLPIIDKPLVQYAVEEAVNVGINEIIFITSPEKFSIKNHFKSLRLKYIKGSSSNISQILKKYKSNIHTIFHFGEFSRIYQSFLKMDECIKSNSIGSKSVISKE